MWSHWVMVILVAQGQLQYWGGGFNVMADLSNCMTSVFVYVCIQESYVSYSDHLRLGGEIISVIGAIIILLLEVHIHETNFLNKNSFYFFILVT